MNNFNKITIENLIQKLITHTSTIESEDIKLLYEAFKSGLDISAVYPVLKNNLYNTDRIIRWNCVDILTEIVSKNNPYQYKVYSHLIKDLRDGDTNTKIKSAESLADITVPDLVSDRDERNIEFAIPALTASLFDGEPTIIDPVIKAISSALYENQDISVAVPSLIFAISTNNENLRKQSSILIRDAVVKGLDITEYLPTLEQYLTDNYEPVKFAVADALTYFYSTHQNWNKVKQLLNHTDKDVRQESAGTLYQGYSINIAKVLNELKKLLQDKDKDVRLVSARTLVKGAKNIDDIILTFPIVIEMLSDKKDENRVYASNIVYNIITAFIDFQKKPKNKKLGMDFWQPIDSIYHNLEKALHDKNEKVVVNVANSLVRYFLRVNKSERIIQILKNSNEEIRKNIIKNLERDNFEKPSDLVSYIARLQSGKLIEELEMASKKGIKTLDLSSRDISKVRLLELPPEIGNITSLIRLDISQNNLTFLPNEIGNLVELKEFIATSNKLKYLPSEIGNLVNLEHLYLYHNQLISLPCEIRNLKKLKLLQLTQNNLKNLPKEIGELENLNNLDLKENKITVIPKEIGNLKNLKYLDLSNNKLKNLPKEIANLNNLEAIYLSGNLMNKIPECIFELENLKYLSFANNNLVEIPQKIEKLKKLETLELMNNYIASLPDEIGNLCNLKHLNLTRNQIKSLPSEIKNLKNLNWLALDYNKLDIPVDIIRRSNNPAEIINTYFYGKGE